MVEITVETIYDYIGKLTASDRRRLYRMLASSAPGNGVGTDHENAKPAPIPEPDAAIPEPVAFCAEAIASPFFSVDIARRADGVERIVEIGDGQVSDIVGWSVDSSEERKFFAQEVPPKQPFAKTS